MRRALLIQAACAVPTLSWACMPGDAWTVWADRFVRPDGRVVDDGQAGRSHSEGQGYGLLLAQAAGDRDAFARIEGWTRRNLAIRDDALAAWMPEDGPEAGWHNATDGDLFRAWALLRAARQSGWSEWEGDARPIAQAIATLCLAPDPRAPDEPVLKPGAEFLGDLEGVVFNPSYIMPRALRELGAAFDLDALVRAADHGETLLRELSVRGPIPDWVVITQDGYRPWGEQGFVSGYDALRVPLYLVWSGRREHPAVARGIDSLRRQAMPGHLVTSRRGDRVLTQSDLPGYHALLDLTLGASVPTPQDCAVTEHYYPSVLYQLAIVAAREAGR